MGNDAGDADGGIEAESAGLFNSKPKFDPPDSLCGPDQGS
jgi:hypothetical protein